MVLLGQLGGRVGRRREFLYRKPGTGMYEMFRVLSFRVIEKKEARRITPRVMDLIFEN